MLSYKASAWKWKCLGITVAVAIAVAIAVAAMSAIVALFALTGCGLLEGGDTPGAAIASNSAPNGAANGAAIAPNSAPNGAAAAGADASGSALPVAPSFAAPDAPDSALPVAPDSVGPGAPGAALPNASGSMAPDATGDSPDGLPTIRVAAMKVASERFDGDAVSRALDAYVAPLIGAHVELEFIEHEQLYATLVKRAAANDLPDVMLMWSARLESEFAREGRLAPLDGFLAGAGQAVADIVGEDLITARSYGGRPYVIATMMDRTSGLCFEYRAGIAERYGIDMSKVNDYESLTAALALLRAADDGVAPISAYDFRTWDRLGDGLGVLMDGGRSSEVVNLYETEEYIESCRLIKRWREAGLLLDSDIGQTYINNFVRSPEFFGKLCRYHPALAHVDSADSGERIECIVLGSPFVTTDNARNGGWAISADTDSLDACERFLAELYVDANAVNLLMYGIEGVHYEMLEGVDGVVGFPEGVTQRNSGYAQFRGYQYGNQFIGYLWESYPRDLWDRVKAYNRDSPRSSAYGFAYDRSPVAQEAEACAKAVDYYAPLLDAGVGDVDGLVGELRAALREAGIGRIIAEKQRQLDSWIESGSLFGAGW